MLDSIEFRGADEAPTTPTRVAVVGLGYWGPNLMRVLAEQPEVEVSWICDLDRGRLEQYRQRYPSARTTSEFSRVLNDDRVDAVVIATPVQTHYELAAQALLAGKHTFVEKPLADSAERADDLVEIADANDRVLMCGHTFIYSPPVRAVKRLLDERAVGDVYFISASRVNLGLHQRDVSVVWDLAPHDFSILLYWLNELPVSIRAIGRASIVKDITDVAFVTMKFASGMIVNCELSWLAPSKLRRTVIVGSEKMVIYDDGSSEPVRVFDSGVVYRDPETFGEYHLSYRSGDILSPKIENYEPLGRELRDFVQACRLGIRMEFHTVLARSVVRMIEAAERSLALGGQAIDLDHSDLGDRLRDLSLTELDDAPPTPRLAVEPRDETELVVDGLSR
jgi:predicted dehydrogenase